MNPSAASRRHLRSAGALLAGLLAIVLPSIATDVLMHGIGIFPPAGTPMSNGLWLLAAAYRVVYGVAGCFVAARLSPDRPMRHAMLLGAVGCVLGLVGAVATWNGGPAFGPKWYPLAVFAMPLPCAWAGGRLCSARQTALTAAAGPGA